MSYKKRFSEIQCPQCREKFRIKKGKPKTLKQWRMPLITHLIVKHHLSIEQTESVIDKYFKSLEG